jgi:SAM-dependent methyltransferase
MDTKNLRDCWDKLARRDALWSILAWSGKRGKWAIDEFFATGEEEISSVMEHIASLGIDLSHKTALDFGCGAGRLTQALADHFDQVYGVDVAPTMIALANEHNRCGDRCKFFLNEASDLESFADGSFDFVYSSITLQHMEPRHSTKYIGEFLRVLDPQGLLVFQLPSEPRRTAKGLMLRIMPAALFNMYTRVKHGAPMELHWVKRADVITFLEHQRGDIVDVQRDQSAGKDMVSFRYYVKKRGSE